MQEIKSSKKIPRRLILGRLIFASYYFSDFSERIY